jgi:hypothetical protein
MRALPGRADGWVPHGRLPNLDKVCPGGFSIFNGTPWGVEGISIGVTCA